LEEDARRFTPWFADLTLPIPITHWKDQPKWLSRIYSTTNQHTLEDTRLDQIEVRPDHRDIDQKTVDSLAVSLHKEGLSNRIVLSDRLGSGRRVLTVGRHRLEAARQLNWLTIPSYVLSLTETEERLCEISENLCRAELSRLDRARQITEWRRLTGRTIPEDGDGEPTQVVSVRETAKAFAENREDVRRSAVIDNITPETERVVREAGLEDNQSALIEVGKQPTPEAILATAKTLAATKALKPEPKPTFKQQAAKNKADAEKLNMEAGVLGIAIRFGKNDKITLLASVWERHAKKILTFIEQEKGAGAKGRAIGGPRS
jgi:ParB-like nuclease domain